MKYFLQVLLIMWLFALINPLIHSQNFFSARNTGMGSITTTSCDVWSVNNNQASLAYLQNIAIGLNYNNHFLLKELSTKNLSMVAPFAFASLGFTVSNFGYSGFSLTQTSMACGKKIYKNLAAGVRIGLVNVSQGKEYGSVNMLLFSTGILYKINNRTELGIIMNNPFYKTSAEKIFDNYQVSYKLGIKQHLSDKVCLLFQSDKYNSGPVKLKIGAEFNNNKFIFNCGISTSPYEYSFGIGLFYRNLLLFLANEYNQYLGFSPAASIQCTL